MYYMCIYTLVNKTVFVTLLIRMIGRKSFLKLHKGPGYALTTEDMWLGNLADVHSAQLQKIYN